jgi:hypothetical protein
VRLSRHAKNRLRFIRRSASAVTDDALLDVLAGATELRRDARGNRVLAVRLDDVRLTVVVDDVGAVVITIWREE